VISMQMLGRRGRPRRHHCLDEAQTMPSVRAVLDDATADRAAARLFAFIWSHDEDRHVSPFF
jgi:hypothetical protein